MIGKILKIAAVCGIVVTVQGGDHIHFQQGIKSKTKSKGFITFWSQKPGGKIKHLKDANGTPIAKLTGGTTNNYLTPMIHLKPVKITNKTVLSFQLKCPVSSLYKINLTNGVENAWYRLRFEAKANEWVTFRQYLSSASFSRNLSKKKIINDGMLGDTLTCVQIEAKGKEVLLKNFKIYESEKTVHELPKIKPITRANYKLNKYPRFDRGGFFPFGVISTVKAGNEKNGKYFSQSLEERRKMDLLSIRRLNFNTYCNFVDETLDVAERLKAMEQFDLYLMETAAAYLDYLGDSGKTKELVKKYDSHDRLVAWYGRDEPSNFEKYIDWKEMVNKHSPSCPFSSAFDSSYKIKVLGSLMEIVMPDVYPLTVTTRTPAHDIVTKTGAQIRLSKKYSGNGKVWSIHQAYSLRRKQDKENFFLLRYPTPVEIRFDFYNALAAGSEGIIYFIFNDEVPFLDGKIRREEFDRTMVDPWYNANATTRELARLGCNVVPVAASLMRAKEISSYKYSTTEKIIRRVTKNEFGRYYYIVNANLNLARKIKFNPKLYTGDVCVNLITGKKMQKNQITLQPGSGTIFMVGTTDNVNKILSEITARKLFNALNLAELENGVLSQAGQKKIFLDKNKISEAIKQEDWAVANAMINKYYAELDKFHNGNTAYALTAKKLASIRKKFGEIYNILIQPKRIDEYDGKANQKYQAQFDKIKDFSKEYFALYRKWENGQTC
jgi:hypothetical protein